MSSSTERSRKFRERLKNDEKKLEAYQRKDRERKAKQYPKAKSTMSEKEKHLLRNKKRERQRHWRAKKKSWSAGLADSSSANEIGTSFKSPQSFGKTVRKVKKSLPQSPSKVPHVIAKVVDGMSPRKRRAVRQVCDQSAKRRKLDGANRKRRSDALSDVEVKEIEEFFLRDDISRICPGRKEFVSVKTPTGREQKQKRLLLLNVTEAYEIFIQESQVKVGLSKFASLIPQQVVPMSLHDQEVCMYKYHENIELLLDGLHSILPGVPKTAEDLLNTTVCNPNDMKCMARECAACKVEKPVEELFEGCDENLPVFYYQWNISDEGRVQKEQIYCTAANAKEDLKARLQPFGRHVYNIRQQFEELKYLKDNLTFLKEK